MKNIYRVLFVIFSFYSSGILSQTQGVKIASPSVDGSLNSTEWSGAKVFTNFYKFIPKTEDNTFDSTVVYIKQTKDALYFAFDYYPKGKIISKSLVRDRSTEDENEFFIVLDLENKKQNGYMFAFSFLNNQRDALIYNQRNQSGEWDWRWEVKSTMIKEPTATETGHIQTEVKIPVDRLQNKNQKTIGVDVQMFSYNKDGTYYYYSLIPDSELLSLRNTYQLDLTTPFDENLNLDVNLIPFAVGQTFNNDSDTLQVGGDLYLSLDKHTMKATYNPDDFTLEADPFRFSLYARPIYLQEKRPFFSKDLDLFRTPINLFYTRAIEDIKYGFNYSYRSDILKAGAVLVNDINEYGEKRNFFIARPKMSFQDINIGSMIILSNVKESEYKETIMSFDGSYRFPDNPIRFQAQYANSISSIGNKSSEGNAYNLYAYYQYDNNGGPYADLSYNRVNPGFFASTYFNSQTQSPNNYDQINVSGGYNFVYDRKYFNDMNFNAGYFKLSTLEERGPFPSGFNFQKYLYFSSNFKVAEFLRFNQYFEYNKPNSIDANGELVTYTNTAQDYNASIFLGTNYINVGYYFGPYFGSFIQNPYISGNVFLFDRLALNGSLTFVNLDDSKRTILNTGLNWKIMNKLFLRSYYQRDNLSKQALWNSILQYEFFAGSNAYLVVNMNGENLQYIGKYFKLGYDFTF